MKIKMANRKNEVVNKPEGIYKKALIKTFSILITMLSLGWWMANFRGLLFKEKSPERIIVGIVTFFGVIFYSYYILFCNNKSKISKIEYLWMLTIAFFVRIVLASLITGHPIDVNCFKVWMSITSTDILNIYEKNVFIDYLPGYLIILAGFKNIASITKITISEDLLIKLPNILADIAIGIMVLNLKQKCGSQPTREESAIILFNPVLILLSSIWGQSDSFVAMLLVLLFICLVYNVHILAGIVVAYLLFTKPQFILFFPLIALYWVYNLLIRNNIANIIKQMISFSIISCGLYFLFMPHKDILWLPKFFIKIAGEYPYYTVNAFNIYYAGGLNWIKTGSMNNAINIIVLTVAYVLFFVQVGFKLKVSKDYLLQLRYLTQGAFVVGLLSFNLMTGMHERYLIFAWLFCLILYALINDLQWLRISLILSLLIFLNISKVLDLSLVNNYYVERDFSNSLVTIVNIVILSISLYIMGRDILKNKSNANNAVT